MEREKALGDFGVMKIFCTMIGIILTKMFTLTTTHQSLHSNWVNFFEYELYLKKNFKVSKHIYTQKVFKKNEEDGEGIRISYICLWKIICYLSLKTCQS